MPNRMQYNSMHLATVEAVWSGMGKQTTNLEKWSQSTKIYLLEALVSGNGPAMSVASISYGLLVEIGLRGATSFLPGLILWHLSHVEMNCLTSLSIDGQ